MQDRMILNAGNGKFIGSLLFMASLTNVCMASYHLIYNDLSHLASTLGRDETVFYIIKLSCVTNINIFYFIKLKKY